MTAGRGPAVKVALDRPLISRRGLHRGVIRCEKEALLRGFERAERAADFACAFQCAVFADDVWTPASRHPDCYG